MCCQEPWGRVNGWGGGEEVSTPDEVDEGRETHDLAKDETFQLSVLIADEPQHETLRTQLDWQPVLTLSSHIGTSGRDTQGSNLTSKTHQLHNLIRQCSATWFRKQESVDRGEGWG